MKRLVALILLAPLTGCVSTATSIATAPVRAASWTVDKMTTSQSEADRNLGRKVRKEEKKRAREERKRQREAERERYDR